MENSNKIASEAEPFINLRGGRRVPCRWVRSVISSSSRLLGQTFLRTAGLVRGITSTMTNENKMRDMVVCITSEKSTVSVVYPKSDQELPQACLLPLSSDTVGMTLWGDATACSLSTVYYCTVCKAVNLWMPPA